MKRILSVVLAALIAASVLASCASPAPGSAVTSSAYADESWLIARIGTIPDSVRVGLASDLGIDMSSFEDDGYLIRTEGGETVLCGKTADGLDRAVRAYAKAYEAGRTVPDATYHEGYRIDRLTIAGRDISDYTIAYEGGSAPFLPSGTGTTVDNACMAATELARLVKKACGADLPVVPAAEAPASPLISIGYLTDGDHGENGFAYSVENGNVTVNGVGTANGCLNGVYYFLETELHWDGLLYGDSDLAESDHLDIPDGTSADVDPMFDYYLKSAVGRDPYVTDMNGTAVSYQGRIARACHGIQTNQWGGFKTAEWSQPCYADESYIAEVCAQIYDYLLARPTQEYVDVAMGDNMAFCHCKLCNKIAKEENGTNSGPIVRFANAIDEFLRDEMPDRTVAVQIFAYHGSNVPCVTPPNDNVYVTFCTDGCCVNHCLDGSENCDPTFDFMGVMGDRFFSNADYGEWIRGWCALSDNVYVWHYGLDNVLHQYTHEHALYEDLMFLKEAGVKGFYYESVNYSFGDRRIRGQEITYLQYHPDTTREEYNDLVRHLYDKTFGDGGAYALTYTLTLWEKNQLARGCTDCWSYVDLIHPSQFDYPIFHSQETEALDLIEKTVYLADSAAQELFAKKFSLDLLYKICYYNYFRAYDRGDEAELARLEELYALFMTRFTECGYGLTFTAGDWCSFTIHPTLEEAAWLDWIGWRTALSDRSVDTRPAPEAYAG